MDGTIEAIVLGVVEGLTEFLPISSTGHMILVGALIKFEGKTANVFEIVIQFGAILAVFILYWKKFAAMLNFKNLASEKRLTAYHLAVGCIPVMGIAYLGSKFIKEYLFSPLTVIVGLVAGAVLMLYAEKTSARPRVRSVDKITISQAFIVGLFQIFSLWPGFSRSGSTISGGLIMGLSRTAAAEFSIIVAVPIMLTAFVYELLKVWSVISSNELYLISIGFVIAFVVAYISVVWFLRFLNKSSLTAFAYYRIVIAGITAYFYWDQIIISCGKLLSIF